LIGKNCSALNVINFICFRATKVEVYIGGVNRLALEPNEQYFKTQKYLVHENYQPSTLANDIALAFLEKDVQISSDSSQNVV
jgi:secreted trypsin-like serine protease